MNSQEIEKYLDERRAAIETRKKDSTTKMIINDSPDYFALEVDDLIKEGWEIVGSPFIIQGSIYLRNTSLFLTYEIQ